MNLWVATAGLLCGLVVWVLLVRKLSVRTWEQHGVAEAPGGPPGDVGALAMPPARIGLFVFLAVVTSLFALFIAAYFMRMGHGHAATHGITDWHPVPKPDVLWLNTIWLAIGSLAMQLARDALHVNRRAAAIRWLGAGGAFAVLFLIGQLLAWQQLQAAGYVMCSTGPLKSNGPAAAFFYVLTAVHGLHLIGGLAVWGRTVARLSRRATELIDVRLAIELCTVYWHYLLLVWLVLFVLLLST
jgi:cytochrome c oxidase subunit III